MKPPPHILVLPTWYPNARRPDYAVFFRVQTQALQRAGARVGVIFPELREFRDVGGLRSFLANRFQISHAAPDGYPVVRWHGWRFPKLHAFGARLFGWAAYRLYKAYVARHGRPDLILAHTAINAGWAAAHIAQRENLPFVVVEHSTHFARGFYNPAQLARVRRCFHAAKAVYAVSEPFAARLADQFDCPVQYAPNAIDTQFFAPADPPSDFRSDRPVRLAFVGTMDAKKGVDVLLRALAQVQIPQGFELRMIGEGPSLSDYKALAQSLGLADKVHFLGHGRQTQVRDLMRQADVFVLPSRFETFGVVLIEALATGTPVVATRSGGPETIVTTPMLGQLVAPEDIGALAQAIQDETAHLAAAPRDLAHKRNADIAARFGADARARAFLATLTPFLPAKEHS